MEKLRGQTEDGEATGGSRGSGAAAAPGLKGRREKDVLSEHRGWDQPEGARSKERDFQGGGPIAGRSVFFFFFGGGEQETSEKRSSRSQGPHRKRQSREDPLAFPLSYSPIICHCLPLAEATQKVLTRGGQERGWE